MEATWYARGTAGHEAHGQWAVYDSEGKAIAIVCDGPKHAHLLAAAPALLEALRELVDDFSRCAKGCSDGYVAKARAAIAKAEGGGE